MTLYNRRAQFRRAVPGDMVSAWFLAADERNVMTKQNFFVMIALVIGAVFCWQAAQSQPKSDEDAELYRLFVDSLENIDRNYVKKVKRRELIESAINGMLSRLDEHSNFIPPTNLNMFERQTKGSFGGIGIRLETDNPKEKFPMITEVLYARRHMKRASLRPIACWPSMDNHWRAGRAKTSFRYSAVKLIPRLS